MSYLRPAVRQKGCRLIVGVHTVFHLHIEPIERFFGRHLRAERGAGLRSRSVPAPLCNSRYFPRREYAYSAFWQFSPHALVHVSFCAQAALSHAPPSLMGHF